MYFYLNSLSYRFGPKRHYFDVIFAARGVHIQSDELYIVVKSIGPVLIFVECATDNTTRTVANVKSYFNKLHGMMVPTGSLEFMFSRKAVFEFVKPDGIDIEELELELIDAGLDEIEENEGEYYAYADYTSFGEMVQAFERLKIEVKKAVLKRFPNDPVEFTEEQLEEIEKLVDKLEEDDDVQAVYTNIA